MSWTDRVRNEEELHRVKENRNITHTTKRRIGHILRRNCLLKHQAEGKRRNRGKDEEECVSTFSMTFRKKGNIVN